MTLTITRPGGAFVEREDSAQELSDKAAKDAIFVAEMAALNAKAYRRDRAQAYDEEIGDLGDQLDILQKALRHLLGMPGGDRAAFEAMAAKIDDIKARHPAPPSAP